MTWLAHRLRKVQSPGEVDSRHCPPPAQNQTTPFKSPEYLDHVFQMQFYVLPGASNYPFSWLTGQETYAFLPIALSSFSFLSYCTVPTPLLKTFQNTNCFPNALRSHPPQSAFDWSSSMFSLSLPFLSNAPSSPPGNLPQQGVHGRYISQPLLLWLPWSKVGLGTEFLIQNHSLPESGKGGGLRAMAVRLRSLPPVTFSSTLLAFTRGLIQLGCGVLVEEWTHHIGYLPLLSPRGPSLAGKAHLELCVLVKTSNWL